MILVGSDGYYLFDPFNLIVYVTDQTLGISDISLNKGIYGGNGEIIISSDRSQIIKIFNLSGQKVSLGVQFGLVKDRRFLLLQASTL